MLSSEKQLAIIRDIFLPVDVHTRYDIYFTDKRIAIVCMGHSHVFEAETAGQTSFLPAAFGVPQIVDSYLEKTPNKQTIDEETKNWSLSDLLKLSKKSCFYTLDEIEEIKLVLGHKPKFIILSNDCESKFSPDWEQVKQLIEVVPTIETLRNKFSIAGSWNTLQEIFKASFAKQFDKSVDLNNKAAP